jgi:hypothetical protein
MIRMDRCFSEFKRVPGYVGVVRRGNCESGRKVESDLVDMFLGCILKQLMRRFDEAFGLPIFAKIASRKAASSPDFFVHAGSPAAARRQCSCPGKFPLAHAAHLLRGSCAVLDRPIGERDSSYGIRKCVAFLVVS